MISDSDSPSSIPAIAQRRAELRRKLDMHSAAINEIQAEIKDLETAERVLSKLAPQLWQADMLGVAKPEPPPPKKMTIPEMIERVVSDFQEQGVYPTGQEILKTIKDKWDADVDPNNVRPTIWRMTKKDKRLIKDGEHYRLPK